MRTSGLWQIIRWCRINATQSPWWRREECWFHQFITAPLPSFNVMFWYNVNNVLILHHPFVYMQFSLYIWLDEALIAHTGRPIHTDNISRACLGSGGHYHLITALIISSPVPPPSLPRPKGTIQLTASCSHIHLLPNWPLSRSGDQALAMATAAQSETPACWHHNYTASPPKWAVGSKLSEKKDKEARQRGRGVERIRNRWGEK